MTELILNNHSSEKVHTSEKVIEAWDAKAMPLIYHQTMYGGKCAVIAEIFEFQKEWISSMVDGNTSFIEIGCGTAEMGSVLFQKASYTVGLDINQVFLDLATELHPMMANCSTNFLVQGNAAETVPLLKSTLPSEFWDTKRIVSMLMNTFGILPDNLRLAVIEQMLMLAGKDGVVVIGCFHSKSFERGIHEFYAHNPQLCGSIHDPEVLIDFENANLVIPGTNYESHWFSIEELSAYFNSELYDIRSHVHGVGVFLVVTAKPVMGK